MALVARLADIEGALAAVPDVERRAVAAPALAELCLSDLPIDEDIAASLTRRAIYLAAAAGAVMDAPAPGGRPVLATAAELDREGLAEPLLAALRRLGQTAADTGSGRVAAVAHDLADRPDEALQALAVVLLTAALVE